MEKPLANNTSDLPTSAAWIVRGFCWYTKKLVRKQFFVMGADTTDCDLVNIDPSTPVIVYCNHPSWWDPIVAMQVCKHVFPTRTFFAPIDRVALEKYAVFKRLGFFGIALESHTGAADFLKQTHAILHSKNASIWITPEGRFVDPRDQSTTWMPGLAHMFMRNPHAVCIPMAMEYPFIDESKPLILCKLGKVLDASSVVEMTKSECSGFLEMQLKETQKRLAQSVIKRSFDSFQVLIRQSSKPRTIYDWGRWFVCLLSGRSFELSHGKNFHSS